jgi:hypothetical protein
MRNIIVKNYAEVNIETTYVVNTVVFENEPMFVAPEGYIFVEAPEGVGAGYSYVNGEFIAPPPPDALETQEPTTEPIRVTKARFGDLFTVQQQVVMNLIRWQIAQMDITDRMNPDNPLNFAEILFQKFDLPAEFIELDHPSTIQGIGFLGLLGVFGSDPVVREAEIERVLSNTLP